MFLKTQFLFHGILVQSRQWKIWTVYLLITRWHWNVQAWFFWYYYKAGTRRCSGLTYTWEWLHGTNLAVLIPSRTKFIWCTPVQFGWGPSELVCFPPQTCVSEVRSDVNLSYGHLCLMGSVTTGVVLYIICNTVYIMFKWLFRCWLVLNRSFYFPAPQTPYPRSFQKMVREK